jgi:hypothetical protein
MATKRTWQGGNVAAIKALSRLPVDIRRDKTVYQNIRLGSETRAHLAEGVVRYNENLTRLQSMAMVKGVIPYTLLPLLVTTDAHTVMVSFDLPPGSDVEYPIPPVGSPDETNDFTNTLMTYFYGRHGSGENGLDSKLSEWLPNAMPASALKNFESLEELNNVAITYYDYRSIAAEWFYQIDRMDKYMITLLGNPVGITILTVHHWAFRAVTPVTDVIMHTHPVTPIVDYSLSSKSGLIVAQIPAGQPYFDIYHNGAQEVLVTPDYRAYQLRLYLSKSLGQWYQKNATIYVGRKLYDATTAVPYELTDDVLYWQEAKLVTYNELAALPGGMDIRVKTTFRTLVLAGDLPTLGKHNIFPDYYDPLIVPPSPSSNDNTPYCLYFNALTDSLGADAARIGNYDGIIIRIVFNTVRSSAPTSMSVVIGGIAVSPEEQVDLLEPELLQDLQYVSPLYRSASKAFWVNTDYDLKFLPMVNVVSYNIMKAWQGSFITKVSWADADFANVHTIGSHGVSTPKIQMIRLPLLQSDTIHGRPQTDVILYDPPTILNHELQSPNNSGGFTLKMTIETADGHEYVIPVPPQQIADLVFAFELFRG